MLTGVIIVALLLALLLAISPSLALSVPGRAFAFAALLALPVCVGVFGLERHVEHSKQTSFCISCHVMDLHGRSLRVDDDSLLVAAHFQRGLVPRDTACFSCHTTYTMYGDLSAKLRGLHHVWVNYVVGVPKEIAIRTYDPYNNRECLHCHEGTRRFEEGKIHRLEPGRMRQIRTNAQSCLAKGCHEVIHDVAHLDGIEDWKPPADQQAAALHEGGAR